uniref:Uncharacterized protein n=1 Tax=candidate division WOR-3 bacterium TaxID=2052148 RepID=A0A7C4GFV8_UNCW3
MRYQGLVTANGGTPAYVWSAAGLPRGLVIDTMTGLMTGTPKDSGSYALTIKVKDSRIPPSSAQAALSLRITPSALSSGATERWPVPPLYRLVLLLFVLATELLVTVFRRNALISRMNVEFLGILERDGAQYVVDGKGRGHLIGASVKTHADISSLQTNSSRRQKTLWTVAILVMALTAVLVLAVRC